MICSELIDKVKDYFSKNNEGIAYVLLFGSRIKGEEHVYSDIDIAVRPYHGYRRLLVKRLPFIITDLARELDLSEDLIDVSIIEPSRYPRDLGFLYSVLSEGLFIFGDKKLFVDDIVMISLLYCDHQIELRKLRVLESYLENLGKRFS